VSYSIRIFDKPTSSPKCDVDCIEFKNQFGIMPCLKKINDYEQLYKFIEKN